MTLQDKPLPELTDDKLTKEVTIVKCEFGLARIKNVPSSASYGWVYDNYPIRWSLKDWLMA
jgi:hypothetical protein